MAVSDDGQRDLFDKKRYANDLFKSKIGEIELL